MMECTLHNLLTSCQYPQVFWIYQMNDYDENILLTKGTKQEMLEDDENSFDLIDHINDVVEYWTIREDGAKLVTFLRKAENLVSDDPPPFRQNERSRVPVLEITGTCIQPHPRGYHLDTICPAAAALDSDIDSCHHMTGFPGIEMAAAHQAAIHYDSRPYASPDIDVYEIPGTAACAPELFCPGGAFESA